MIDPGRPLVVHGAGGHGRVVRAAAEAAAIEMLGFVDDAAEGPGIRRTVEAWGGGVGVHVAIGDNASRRVAHHSHRRAGRPLVGVEHPTACRGGRIRVGTGVFLGPLAVVGVGTRLGDGCIVNSGAIVEHDGELGAFCHVAPGCVLGGGVAVGAETLIGLGSRVLPGIRIGSGATVGAGSVVLRDVADGETVVGVVKQATDTLD